MKTEINKYLTSNYKWFIQYSRFHCLKSGINIDYRDVVDEVILTLLEKDESFIQNLLNEKKGNHRVVFYYIISSIKRNIYSETAPCNRIFNNWRFTYNPYVCDKQVDENYFNIKDDEKDFDDFIERIMSFYKSIPANSIDKVVFRNKFIDLKPISAIISKYSSKKLYESLGYIRYEMSKIKTYEPRNN